MTFSRSERIASKVLAKMEFKRVRDLANEYSDQWLDAKVTEIKPSNYGKGKDLVVILQGDYPGLPPIIKTDSIFLDYAVETKDKVKVKLHITPGGILVDQLTVPGASKEKKVAESEISKEAKPAQPGEKELAEKLLSNLKKRIDSNITKAKIELIKIIEGENYQEAPIKEFYKSCMDAIKLLDAEGYKNWHE